LLFFEIFLEKRLTVFIYDDIILSMIILENIVQDGQNAFIYFGLGSISDRGREYLKNIAQSLIAIQNHPGFPIPDNICKEIIRESVE